MVIIIKSFLFLILFFASQSFAQSITARASVDSSDYIVGDYITYTLEIKYFKDILITTPFIRDSLKKLEIIQEQEPLSVEDDVYKTDTYTFIVSYYDSADVTIPPVSVQYKNTSEDSTKIILSNAVSFSVQTVEVSKDEDIKDVKFPISIPMDWKIILLISLIIVAILVMVYILYKRYKKKKLEKPVKKEIIKIPLHLQILAKLDNLEKEKLWQNGRVKEYHTNITDIIRSYFEGRFELPALELTTRESIERLKNVKEANGVLEITNDFLNNADLVKFAKYIPMASVNEEMMKQAREIVNKTIPAQRESIKEEVQMIYGGGPDV